jgi:tryptophan halogenase
MLDNGDDETADVFFDCTGFSKVIHKEVGSTWKSLKELLPVDSAIPCPIDWSSPMNTTHASTLTSGWVWQVPLQTRIGTGYVYSSSFAKNPEDEFAEFIFKKYGKNIDIGRTIKFESGYVANPWNKNVVCIGLSSGFIEPLESTSIHMIQHQVLGFTQMYDGVITKKITSLYNGYMCDMYEDAAAFIKLHYLVNPYNSEFWNYMNNSVGHPRLENLLEIWKTHLPSADHIGQNKNSTVGYRIFAIAAWLQVMQGVGKLTKTSIKRFITFNELPKFEKDFSNLLTQREFLSRIVKK